MFLHDCRHGVHAMRATGSTVCILLCWVTTVLLLFSPLFLLFLRLLTHSLSLSLSLSLFNWLCSGLYINELPKVREMCAHHGTIRRKVTPKLNRHMVSIVTMLCTNVFFCMCTHVCVLCMTCILSYGSE